MLGGVGPSVRVVEVEHESHAGILYHLSETLHVVQVLHHSLFLVCGGGVSGIDEEAYSHGIHALVVKKLQGIVDGCSICLIVMCSVVYIGGEQ